LGHYQTNQHQLFDILLFNEIWQIKDFEKIKIPEFNLENINQRVNSKGGGALIFVKNNLKFEILSSPNIEGVIETSAICIGNNVFASLYRPPAGNKHTFVELSDWIENLGHKNIYIGEDFNLNYIGNDKTYFENIEIRMHLKPAIKSITRLASSTCIDNILTSQNGTHRVSNICIADHQGLSSHLKIQNIKREKELHKYREMRETNWNMFTSEVSKLYIRGNSLNEKWNNLTQDIKTAVNKLFPEKYSSTKYKFFMSRGLIRSKNKKNKLLRQYKRGIIEKEVYVRYNKIYRKLVAKEQEEVFNSKMIETRLDTKKKWKVFKEELKMSTVKEQITAINDNGVILTNKNDLAKSFKNHFQTCATKLAQGIQDQGECEILCEQQPKWGFKTVTERDILKIIDSLQPKASCGFDLLSNKMIKKERVKFSKLTVNLINETLLNGTFPEVLKTAKVIPIFKKGDKQNLNNYRPISLLPVLSKVLEKIINKQITEELNEFHLIDDDQYGFRAEHSTH
jgi:hypothetical protein